MKKLRISSTLNLHVYPKEDISEYIRRGLIFLKEAGFDAADFPMALLDSAGGNWEKVTAEAARDAEKIGIRWEICHLPFSTKICTDPESLPPFCEKMHRAIDAAAILGVERAVLHPNTTTLPMEMYDEEEQFSSVTAHLTPFAEHAEKGKVRIAVENMRVVPAAHPVHRYCQTAEELCRVADTLGFAVCWDFGHAHISGLKQSEALAYVGKRLKVLHVNDNVADDDIHLPPFFGTLDWKDAMQGLAATGFDGLFNYEVAAKRIPASLRESFAAYLVRAAQEIQSYLP